MDILDDTRHRQWPLPDEPWILRQSWNDLLFMHWQIDRDALRSRVPAFLALDEFDGPWISITPFRLTDLSPRGLPALPWISSFNEVNVRTYVVYDGMPGIFFFSLDADSAVAVAGASTAFHLPYYLADMALENDRGRLTMKSRRKEGAAEIDVQYAPTSALFEPAPGTLDYWLTERYCLYAVDAASRRFRVEIQHRPWQLQHADAEIRINTMASAAGLTLPAAAPLLQFARRQDVLTWRPHLLS